MSTPDDASEVEVTFKDASAFAFTAALVAGQAGAPVEVLDALLDAARNLTDLARNGAKPAPA